MVKLLPKNTLPLCTNILKPINPNKTIIFTKIQRDKEKRLEHLRSKPREHYSKFQIHIQGKQIPKSKKPHNIFSQ